MQEKFKYNILSVIQAKLRWQKDNTFDGRWIYIDSETLTELKRQQQEKLFSTHKLNTIYGLEIYELTPQSTVCFGKSDICLLNYYFDEDIKKLSFMLDIPEEYLDEVKPNYSPK